MREYPLDIMVEMLLEYFEINTLKNEFFRMRALSNLIDFGLLEDIPLLAKEIKRQQGEILLDPIRTLNSEAAKQLELWLEFV
ncbi:hypothetical protein [Sutcliffiella sp. NC1]|uniref:hypothetical protein n=1 Tax=Sutcliffiella sp. NC1 TaxID=3004096 RepID=UPI0022DE7431|nr:hypothetical protein [Sutcliffiella sp. NC1]WBL16943.1 hypothetical protein O1A01_10045 [Sutcliffiella sp. NC1]